MKDSDQKSSNTKKRDLLWAFIALVVFIGICLAVLIAHNPAASRSSQADGLHLAIVHTNDTLGYLSGCG